MPPRNGTKGVELAIIFIQGAFSPVAGYKPMLESIQAASTNRLWVAAPQHLLNIAEFEFDRKIDEILGTMKKAIRTEKKRVCVCFFVKG